MSVRPPEVRVLKQQVATHNRKSGQLHQPTDLTFKIAIVGPPRAGKTRLANQMAATPFLSADIPNHSYSETAAVRIQSFGVNVLAAGAGGAGRGGGQLLPLAVECELWDVSGSAQYEQLWPAVCSGLHGVIVVYEPKNTTHQSELKAWLDWFTREARLATGQLLALAHGGGNGAAAKPLKVVVKEGEAGGEVKERAVSVPVVNVPLGGGMVDGGSGSGDGEGGVRAVRLELEQWLGGSVFAFHPKAIETFETMSK